MPSWEIHRKYAMRYLEFESLENVVDDINELIDFPKNQGFHQASHDWDSNPWKEIQVEMIAEERYPDIGRDLVQLHWALDFLRDQSDPWRRAKKEAKKQVSGTVYNPNTGQPMPKTAKVEQDAKSIDDIKEFAQKYNLEQKNHGIRVTDVAEKFADEAGRIEMKDELIGFVIVNFRNILEDITQELGIRLKLSDKVLNQIIDCLEAL